MSARRAARSRMAGSNTVQRRAPARLASTIAMLASRSISPAKRRRRAPDQAHRQLAGDFLAAGS
jgi:hypothetical protein